MEEEMESDEDSDRVTFHAHWGSFQVPKYSFIANMVSPDDKERDRIERIEQGSMHWSFGTELADLLWMLAPEARPLLVDLAVKELTEGVRYDSFLRPISRTEIAWSLYLDLLRPAMSNIAEQRDAVRRCLEALHRVVVEANGDFRWEIVNDHIVRALEREGFRDLLVDIHPEFMELVYRTRDALGQY